MSRVAIIGSCITRDLWPVAGDAAEGLLYVSRTSLPSLLAPGPRGFRARAQPPEPLRRHQHRAMVADIRKTAVARLVAFRPTHIIFDFIDERFDLLAAGRTLVTRTWELEASGYLEMKALRDMRLVPRLSAACDRLWFDAVSEFAALIRATPLAHAKLILHSARWATVGRLAPGPLQPLRGVEIRPGEPVRIEDFNDLLARYEAGFAAVMPPHEVVEAPEHRIADRDHQWGLSPFHYVPAYYEEIWRQLRALGVPAVSVRSPEPSVPAG